MIRAATHADLNDILRIGREIAPQISTHYLIDDFKTRKTLLMLMNARRGCVFVATDKQDNVIGFIAGQVDALWFSKSCYATEIGFLVKPGFPMQAYLLAKAFIAWAKKFDDVVDITLNISSGMDKEGRLGRLYERLGFKSMGGCFSYFK
jgi:hypothetical protein